MGSEVEAVNKSRETQKLNNAITLCFIGWDEGDDVEHTAFTNKNVDTFESSRYWQGIIWVLYD